MGKGIYKQNTADLNNQLKQENKRICINEQTKKQSRRKKRTTINKVKIQTCYK